MNGDISFDSNDLQTYNVLTQVGINTNVIDHTDMPEQVANLFAKADANGSVIPTVTYPSRKINIAGTIHGSSQADLDSRIDTFKGYFIGKDKNLDIAYSSGTRRYIATKNTFGVQRQDHALFARFNIEFICTQPFGVDTSATTILNSTGNTGNSNTVTPTIGGNAPFQYPVITYEVNSITSGGDYLMVSDDQSTQELLLYGLGIQAGDIIVIDSFERTVTINDEPVDFVGTFLELAPGSRSFTITDGFTNRNADILIQYYKRWL